MWTYLYQTPELSKFVRRLICPRPTLGDARQFFVIFVSVCFVLVCGSKTVFCQWDLLQGINTESCYCCPASNFLQRVVVAQYSLSPDRERQTSFLSCLKTLDVFFELRVSIRSHFHLLPSFGL